MTVSVDKTELRDLIRSVAKKIDDSIKGEVLWDGISRITYSTAACIYRIVPSCIVRPVDDEDVAVCVEIASENSVPITARGGGSGRAGQGIGAGIIIDFAKYMNKILVLQPEEEKAVVQPGITLTELNEALAPYDKFFPPDPSSGDCATIGGMIANNSSGPHAPAYGDTKNYIRKLELVLDDGNILIVKPIKIPSPAWKQLLSSTDRKALLHREIYALLASHAELIRDMAPDTTKNCCGYDVWNTLKNGVLDITKLIAGSEGTLALVTKAELSIRNRPHKNASALLYFDGLKNTGEAAALLRDAGASMIEIIEKTILDLARQRWPELETYIPPGVEVVFFIEFQGDDEKELETKIDRVESALVKEGHLAISMRRARTAEERRNLIRVRKASGPVLNRTPGKKKAIAFIEDAAVHPRKLSEYLAGLREILRKYDVQAGIYGHAGDGNLHVMPLLDLSDPDDIKKMHMIAEDSFNLVMRLKGTVSAEHGDGIVRTPFVQRQYKDLYKAFVKIKRLFDPQNIFNPGRIIADPAADRPVKIKYELYSCQLANRFRLAEEDLEELRRCQNCGQCRAYCPIASTTHDELDTARARATLFKEAASGLLDDKGDVFDTKLVEIFNRCLMCHQCLTECPSGVDIPLLVRKYREKLSDSGKVPLAEGLLADTGRLVKLASLLPHLYMLVAKNSLSRFALEISVGIDRRRRLPAPSAARPLLHTDTQLQQDAGVILFPGCFASLRHGKLAMASLARVFQHLRIKTIIAEHNCCNAAGVALGKSGKLRQKMEFLTQKLLQQAGDDRKVLFLEPSCLLTVKLEYPKILRSAAAGKLAAKSMDAGDFAASIMISNEIVSSFGRIPLRIYYHNPCHHKVLGAGEITMQLLQKIPGMTVISDGDACCGMAGTFGLKKRFFDLSLKIGDHLFKSIEKARPDFVATPCTGCALQIEQATGYKILHPAQLIAAALDLEPLPE